MSNRNSKIIISKNIKLDKTYKNVLSYNDTNMLTYVNANSVASRDSYSFIRERDSILADFSYSDAIKCNYMAYQNPDFSNKWFFAFIDNVKYKNDSTVEIFFTIDVWSTWFSKMNFNECFVIREHVNNDTIGVHTLPEGLETGPYVSNAHIIDDQMDNILEDLTYVMSSSVSLYDTDDSGKHLPVTGGLYNGIYSGTKYYQLTEAGVNAKLEELAESGQIDAINGLFIAPKRLATIVSEMSPQIINSNGPQSYTNSISKNYTLNGYTPKNNKLKCYPYNYLLVSNNNGTSVTYNYEDFSGSNCTFNIDMAITPGCSIRMTPTNYRGNSVADEYGINMGKLPICNYNCDMYTNWLTQNSVNIAGHDVSIDEINMAGNIANSTLSVGSSLAMGNYTGVASGLVNGGVSIANSMVAMKQHSLIPPQTRGNLNNGDVITSANKNNFNFYKMSIKSEYARMIDDYFTAKGYKVNLLKLPNITGRSNFNYIQIDNESNLCYGEIPSQYLDVINMIARNGVTIWHNHANMLNYDVSNAIVQ